MRDLTTTELQSVSGGAVAPRPRLSISLVGVKLSDKDKRALSFVLSLLRPRKQTA